MWYESIRSKGLDYSKPIIAEGRGIHKKEKFLLLPQISQLDYSIKGYDWFNVDTGKYNSSCRFSSVKEAMDSYGDYLIYNVEIDFQKI